MMLVGSEQVKSIHLILHKPLLRKDSVRTLGMKTDRDGVKYKKYDE